MLTPRWLMGRHGWLGLGLVACLQACSSNKSSDSSAQTGASGSSGTTSPAKDGSGGKGGKSGSSSTASARGGAAQGGSTSLTDEDAGVGRGGDSAAGGGGSRAAGSGGKPGSGGAGAAGGGGGSRAAGSGGAEAAGSGGTEAAGSGGTEAAGSGGAEAAGSGGAEAATECRTDAAPEIPSLKLETVIASGSLDTLTFATQPPGSEDWYLVEQRGRVLIVRDGKLLDTPFLDLSSEIALGAGFDQTTITYDERGLISLAFAPDYADSGLFYIAITPSAPDDFFSPGLQVNHDQVLEMRRSGDDPDRADKNPLRKLIDVPSSPAALGNIHNANTVRFGPDGKLYVGMGDGGGVNCNDAENGAAQDIDKPFGKLMRLDLGANAPYGASDNPFADRPSAATVLHYGLRNPFRFSFDRETGDLYIGDVGQSTYEEIDFAKAGSQALNFGWPTFEAESRCPGPQHSLRADSSPTSPIFIADRSGTGRFRDYRAIVGGVVYRGSALPQLRGTYVFGDYYGTRLGALKRCGDDTSPANVIRKNCDPNFAEPCLDADRGSPEFRQLTAIVEDQAGEIHLVANGNSLLKVVPGN